MQEEAAKKQMRRIQQEFDRHWSGQDPWRNEDGNLVPGFIEGIAERQPFYKNWFKNILINPIVCFII